MTKNGTDKTTTVKIEITSALLPRIAPFNLFVKPHRSIGYVFCVNHGFTKFTTFGFVLVELDVQRTVAAHKTKG